MSLGRWLLTHSLSLFLAAMLLAAWFWRDELELDRAWSQLRQQAALNDNPTRDTASPPAEKPAGQGQGGLQSSDAGGADESEQPAATNSARGEAPQPAKAREDRGSPPALPAGKSSPATVAAPESQLQAARKAFWSRDFDQAIDLYRQLIAADPENPDYIGELGNIYYNLNRFDEASEMLLRAGRLLVKKGEPQRARLLLPALMSLDRTRGKQLQELLETAEKPAGDSQT